jgi:hypothetical protein
MVTDDARIVDAKAAKRAHVPFPAHCRLEVD